VFHGTGDGRFRSDDGSADPAVAVALRAFAAGEGSEQAALTALARTRLLVPVLAVLADELPADELPADVSPAEEAAASGAAGRDAADSGGVGRDAADSGGASPAACHPQGGGEKTSEMALPTLIGRDGRPAIPAFTCLDALARWQPAARPVPADASQVWQAAAADGSAVVIDIAGPVPLAVEGARLMALARGAAVPVPDQDPDIAAVVVRIVAGRARCRLLPATQGADLRIELTPSAGLDQSAVQGLVSGVGSAVMDALGPRLRRGIEMTIAS
jgi:SseB protein N-terminal domain